MNLIQTYQTNKYFYGKKNACDYIVLHHTGKGETINIVKYLALNPTQVSCHYIVGTKGEIYQIASDDKCTWHAGVSRWDGKENMNLYSIGIEIVSDGKLFTDAQRQSVRELVSSLMQKHSITSQRVIRHMDISPGRKRDVGDNFWNNQHNTYLDYQESYSLKQMTSKKIDSLDPEAKKAMEAGIWNGQNPKTPATREEVAIMMWRGMTKK